MTDTTPQRPHRDTIHFVGIVALLLILADAAITVALDGLAYEAHPIAAVLSEAVGWQATTLLAVGIFGGLYLWLRHRGTRTALIAALAPLPVLAVPVAWNTYIYTQLGTPSVYWPHVTATIAPAVVLTAVVVSLPVIVRAGRILDRHVERQHLRAVALTAIMVLSLPAMFFSPMAVPSDHDGVATASDSDDINVVYSGSSDNTVKAYYADNGTEIWTSTVHTESVKSVQPSPDGEVLYTGSIDEMVMALDTDDGSKVWDSTVPDHVVESVFPSPDGEVVYIGTQMSNDVGGNVIALDANDGSEIWTYSGHENSIQDVRPSPDGGTVYSGASDETVHALDADTGGVEWITDHPNDMDDEDYEPIITDMVQSLHPSPDEDKVYVGLNDFKVVALDAYTGDKEWDTIAEGRVYGLHASPDGNTVYIGTDADNVKALSASDGSEKWISGEHSETVSTVYASPDGEAIYSGGWEFDVKRLDADDGSMVWSADGHSNSVLDVATTTWYEVDGYEISGTVTDFDGEPIEGANVTASDALNTYYDLTDKNGEYSIMVDDAGWDYTITATTPIDTDQVTISDVEDDYTVPFQLRDGDVGGQVVYCQAGHRSCVNSGEKSNTGGASPVSDATVEIIGVSHTDVEQFFDDVNNADEAERKADEMLADLRTFDIDDIDDFEDLDPDDVLTDIDDVAGQEYVVMHHADDWDAYEGTMTRDILSGMSTPDGDLDLPKPFSPSDQPVTFTIWDPEGDEHLEIDEELPGATIDGTIQLEQVGPRGETLSSSELETAEFFAETQTGIGGSIRQVFTGDADGDTKAHQAVVQKPSAGLYRVSAEGSDFETYVKISEGDFEDFFPGYVSDVEDDADELLEMAEEFQTWETEELVEPIRVQTDENGWWAADLPDRVDTVGVYAYKAGSGDGITDLENTLDAETGIADIRQADPADIADAGLDQQIGNAQIDPTNEKSTLEQVRHLNRLGYEGSVYMPSEPVEVDVPGHVNPELRRVDVDSVPMAQPPDKNATDLLDDMENMVNDTLDSVVDDVMRELPAEELTETIDEIEEIEDELDGIEHQYEDLKAMVEELDERDNEDLDRILEERNETGAADTIIEDETAVEIDFDLPDPEEQTDQELVDRVRELEAVTDDLSQQSPEGSETTIENELLSGEYPFPGEIEDDSVSVTAEYADGTTTAVPEDYWHVESSFLGGDAVVVEEYPVPEDRPRPTMNVDAVVLDDGLIVDGGEGVMNHRDSVPNPAYDADIPELQSVNVGSLLVEPGDRITATPVAVEGSGFEELVDARAFGPDGTELDTSVEDGRASVTAVEEGTHTLRLVYTNDVGDEFVERVQVRAQDGIGSVPTSIQVRDDGPPVAGDGLQDATVDIDRAAGTMDVVAVVPDANGLTDLHVRGDGVSGQQLNVEVVEGPDEQSVRQYVSVTVYQHVGDDDLLWINGNAVPHDGNEWGEVRDDSHIQTLTDDSGQLTLDVERDPGILDRTQHWLSIRQQGVPVVGFLTPALAMIAGALWGRRDQLRRLGGDFR